MEFVSHRALDDLHNALRDVEALRERLKTSGAENDALRQDYSTMRREKESLVRRQQALSRELDDVLRERDAARMEKKEALEQRARALEQLDAMSKLAEERSDELHAAQEEVKAEKGTRMQLEREIENLNALIDDLKAQLESTRKDRELCKGERDIAVQDRDAALARARELSDQVEVLKHQNFASESQLGDVLRERDGLLEVRCFHKSCYAYLTSFLS